MLPSGTRRFEILAVGLAPVQHRREMGMNGMQRCEKHSALPPLHPTLGLNKDQPGITVRTEWLLLEK